MFVCVDSIEELNEKEAVVKKLLQIADGGNKMSPADLESNGFSMKCDTLPDDVFAYRMHWESLPGILESQLPL